MSDTTQGCFAGMHVLVTGGGTGIGASIADAFGATGAAVTLVGRRRQPLEDKAAALAAAGARAAPLVCDVTDAAAVERVFGEAVALLGPIDILVNNAGAAESAPLGRVTPDMLARMLSVNLVQLFYCSQAALPGMTARRFGRIINIASTAALTGHAYVTAYTAAKHGALGFTRALAQEVAGSGVTVNAVCPGFTETPMLERSIENVRVKTGRTAAEARAALVSANPLGRAIRPEEVAHAALWLAAPESAAVTGQAIVVAGGAVSP